MVIHELGCCLEGSESAFFSLLLSVTQGSILRFYLKQVTFTSFCIILDCYKVSWLKG